MSRLLGEGILVHNEYSESEVVEKDSNVEYLAVVLLKEYL